MRRIKRLFFSHYGISLRAAYTELLQKIVKAVSVLCHVNAVGTGTQDRNVVLAEQLCQLDRGLTAECHNYSAGIFKCDNVHYILRA